MKISSKGLELIKSEENFMSRPYLCPAKKPTIGYGSTFYPDGTKVTLKDKAITENEAVKLLENLIEKEFDINPLIKVKLTQNQFDALTSFVYNIGMPNFKTSTLLKKLNKGDFKAVIEEFPKWINSNGKKSNGLKNRRAKEQSLFLSDQQ
ncbi:lysozyme [Aliarcobacter butzleri]|uniref:lysozyme n=1 Tax=Aliarcobacter butzleri TaxID=28197 RepID=UPI00263C35A0|nr:lysozyme [Aliarcobacter butzleri]MDN5049784.1 lysozyme [Aliarcobacter butzleri]MDN5056899.1 lysozyme [Aliarcobacter butzleri]